METALRSSSPTPSAIWMLADLRSALPRAEAHLGRMQELTLVLQGLIGEQQLRAIDRALQGVEVCIGGATLEPTAPPRGWRLWRRGQDSSFRSTLVFSEDLLRNYEQLVAVTQRFLEWTEQGKAGQSRAYVDFCLEARALHRFLREALQGLADVYQDLRRKFEIASSEPALGALRTVHGKARAVADLLRQHEKVCEVAEGIQAGVNELAAAREHLLACLGPDFSTHARKLQHYLDDIDARDKPATREEKLMRARTARTELQEWVERSGTAIVRLHEAQEALRTRLRSLKEAFDQLRAVP